jgi:thioesterase domain-containing protein
MAPVIMGRGYSEAVPFRTSGRWPPLFCIGNFQPMVMAMPADQSVYGLNYVNLDGARSSLNLEQLAESHLEALCKVQESGPYRLIGYSLGGLIAFEMARQLESSGKDVGLLALVDTLNPWFYRNLSSAEARRFRRKYLVDRIRKYSRMLKQGRYDRLVSSASRLTEKIAKRLAPKTGTAQQISNGPTSNIDIPSLTEQIARSYTPREFSGRLILFRAEKAMDGGAEFDDHPSLGWDRYSKNGVDIQLVPGGHESVMHMPDVVNLANKLVPYLVERVP